MAENNEARNYLDAYDRWLKLFQINGDYYFKRTQIVMIVIQSALFVAFTKSAWDSNTGGNSLGLISLGLIPFLGIFASLAWYTMITKHHDYIEFCRRHLRNIEYRLVDLGIPIKYFKDGAAVFYYEEPVCFEWSKEQFPKPGQKVRGGLKNIEKQIAFSLFSIWLIFSLAFLCVTLIAHRWSVLLIVGCFMSLFSLLFYAHRKYINRKREANLHENGE